MLVGECLLLLLLLGVLSIKGLVLSVQWLARDDDKHAAGGGGNVIVVGDNDDESYLVWIHPHGHRYDPDPYYM